MRTKTQQIGFRVSSKLKLELNQVAKSEGRTLSQICEIFVAGGLEAYRNEGPSYLHRLVAGQKKM
jgi:hypothetical protein